MDALRLAFVRSIARHLIRTYGREGASIQMRAACERAAGEERDLALDVLWALDDADDSTFH